MNRFSGDVDPLSEGNLDQSFSFLQELHPQFDTAWAVCVEAYTRLLRGRDASQRRLRPKLIQTPASAAPGALGALQHQCLKVSLEWERDQEAGAGCKTPLYTPDAQVMPVRFIANFAHQYLFRERSYHLAVAIGSCLHTYDPVDAYRIACLKDDEDQNVRRKKSDVQKGLQKRFAPVYGVIPMQPPQTHFQRQRMYDILQVFTPWEEDCLAEDYALDVGTDEAPDWDRKHAMLCAGCAGWATLARQYIEATEEAKQRAAADGEFFPWSVPPPPEHSLEIPVFSSPRSQRDEADREQLSANNPKITVEQLRALREEIEKARGDDQHRRSINAFTRLSVAVDGQECAQFTPEAGSMRPFRVSVHDVSLTLAGDDGSGPVLLAHFDLPDPDAEGPPTRLMTVIPGSGATITLTLSPLYEEAILSAWEITAHWIPEALAQKDLAWYDALLGSILNEWDLLSMLGSTDLRRELGEVSQPRLEEIYQGVRTWPDSEGRRAVLLAHLGDAFHLWQQAERAQACWEAGLALAQTAADTALTALLHARLLTSQQPMLTSQPQATPEPAEPLAAWRGLAVDLGEHVVRWLESIWHPTFAGEPVTAAADTPVQEEVFYFESGAIRVTCEWRPASLRLTWETHPPLPGDLWARVVQRDDHSVVLADILLGRAFEGDEVFTAAVLGFEPTEVPWSLTLGLQESQQ